MACRVKCSLRYSSHIHNPSSHSSCMSSINGSRNTSMLIPSCLGPCIRIDKRMYFRFWQIHIVKLYIVSRTGQVLYVLLRSPNGFIPSVLNANLTFLGSFANSKYSASTFFHYRASAECRILPSYFLPSWYHLINSASSRLENSRFRRSLTGRYHITILGIFLSSSTGASSLSTTSPSEAPLPVLYWFVPHVGQESKSANSLRYNMQWFSHAWIFWTSRDNGHINFFAWYVFLGSRFGLGSITLKRSIKSLKLVSDHPCLAFNLRSSSTERRTKLSLSHHFASSYRSSFAAFSKAS